MALVDKLGNPIKVGQFVSTTVLDHNIVCKVVHIKEPSMISVGKDNMQLIGEIVLVSEHHIPFDAKGGAMGGLVVCQTPEHLKKSSD